MSIKSKLCTPVSKGQSEPIWKRSSGVGLGKPGQNVIVVREGFTEENP